MKRTLRRTTIHAALSVLAISFALGQSGDRVSGTASGAGMSGHVEATRSGHSLHFRNEAGDSWTGTLSTDCNSISMTANVDGESLSFTVRR